MNRYLSPAFRHRVLRGALVAATLFSLLPAAAPVDANQFVAEAEGLRPGAPDLGVLAQAATDPKAGANSNRNAAPDVRDAAGDAAATAKEAAQSAVEAQVDADREPRAVRRKGIHIGPKGFDRRYDSFDQFLDSDPALATLILGVVFLVFLTPVLIVALLIWYKVRKTRMLNEAMLKLAERGIVPPGEALEALQTGRTATALQSGPATSSLFAQARAMRSRAAWSDLRKGVLLGAVGLASTVWSIFDERSPNWLGLVLLFVGVGYGALAYFENRQATTVGSTPVANPGDVNN